MKKLSVKYLAGLIDGEGCIDWSVTYDKKYETWRMRPRLRVTLAEPGYDVIDLLYNNFGGNIETRTVDNPKWLNSKTWCVVGSRSVRVLNATKNSLIIKKEQAKLGIAWEKLLKGSPISNDMRDLIKEEMRLMKRDPHRLSEKAVHKIKALKRQSEHSQ